MGAFQVLILCWCITCRLCITCQQSYSYVLFEFYSCKIGLMPQYNTHVHVLILFLFEILRELIFTRNNSRDNFTIIDFCEETYFS